jgi:hypothetical protein
MEDHTMSIAITSAAHAAVSTQPALQPKAATQQPAPAKLQPAPADTVQISAAAQALKEATENPAQTAKEAAGGDVQAKRLLAKEAADKAL